MSIKKQPSAESVYHIVVKGQLDQKWADWFTGFVMTSASDGQTMLVGSGIDQAALHGVLAKIHSLGLRLDLVQRREGL
jgi:hypothetical protein